MVAEMDSQNDSINESRQPVPEPGLGFFSYVWRMFLLLAVFSAGFGTASYYVGRNAYLRSLAEQGVSKSGKVIGLYSDPESGQLSQDVDFRQFWQVWDALKNGHVDAENFSDKTLFYGALKGLAAASGDPYTIYMDPLLSKAFSDELAGTFDGIGAEIGIKDNVLIVVAPLPEMPAEKAGIKAGDQILAINGESSNGFSVDQAVSQIRGPRGTEVKLSIYRKGFDQPRDFIIKRDKITIKSVRGTYNETNGVYTAKISSFGDDTLTEFNELVRQALEKQAKGFVLDLRNNPGGYLDTAVEMASEWIEDGVVVSEKFADGKQIDHRATGKARLAGLRTAVLINQGSASASEIVSGALQDNASAKIIGQQSFGKGSVQNLQDFSDGSSLKVTIAKWLTPKGRSINEQGVTPDLAIELTPEMYDQGQDPQMEAAEIYAAGGELQSPLPLASSTPTDIIQK